MEAQRLQDFSHHVISWTLSAISRTFQVIGQLHADTTLEEDIKNEQIANNQNLLLNLAHLLVPFADIAEELFPQYKPIIEIVKKIYQDAVDKGLIKVQAPVAPLIVDHE